MTASFYNEIMYRTCTKCRGGFAISTEDLAFYDHISPVFAGKKYSIPPPVCCPRCRQRHRLAFRNQTALFPRLAFPHSEKIFSMYPLSAPFPVMRNEDWFSDQWDAFDYGREFSFQNTLMEQLFELHKTVPRYVAINNIRTENCEYCNNASDDKNCYLTFSMANAEDCLYGESVWGSKDCVENTLTIESELCYDCTNCTRCVRLQGSFNCENCSDSFFLLNCRNCRDCFGCVNLRNKNYCIWNEQRSREEYEFFIKSFDGSSFRERAKFGQEFENMALKHPRPHTIMHQTEDCTGNCILESRNVKSSNFIQRGENLDNCINLYDKTNDCRDYTFFGRSAELIYNCCTCGNNISRLCFCYTCRNQSSDLFYCISCDGCKNCFGCIGLWRKEYCVLNKQYTKDEYERIVPKIIEHIRTTKEWGEFFPVHFNPMPYNRSLAYRYYPMSEGEAKREGYSWYEEDIKDFPGAIEASQLPDGLPQTDAPIVVMSAMSGRPFCITTREIKRYRELKVPLPRDSYEERMNKRARKLGSLQLFERSCAKTGKAILTPYPPDSPYIIWDRDEYESIYQ